MTLAAHATAPFSHDLVLHDGPGELVDLMVPFVRDGAAAGDDVVVLGEPEFVAGLLSSVPVPVPRLHVFAEPERERAPGRDLHRFHRLLARLDAPQSRVRVVNQMPVMTTERWPEWRRYEAAVNVVLSPYRASGKCAHDATRLVPGMLADLTTTHAAIQTPDGRRSNPHFDRLGLRAAGYLDVPPHPVEHTEPTLWMARPTAAAARRAVRNLAIGYGLPPTAQECVILATSEAVTNGWVHGRPPVLLRAWAAPGGSVTVAVSDAGPGPHPLVGLVPEDPGSGTGDGMWLIHLILRDVHHRRSERGYTVTFTVDRDTALPRRSGLP